ncbi:Prod protein [Dirofilaria immitis]|nr:Prod protein [Dirofilaria immitis]
MPAVLLRSNNFASVSNFRSLAYLSYRMASSETSSQTSAVNIDEIKGCYNKLDLDFKSTKTAFKGKRTSELFRGLIVLPLCTIQTLRNKEQLIMVGLKKVFGEKLYKKLLKLTFFGQFVGGETIDEVKETMIRLKKCGVKSILDYCVESDISSDEAERKAVEGIVGGEARIEPVGNIVDKATVEKHDNVIQSIKNSVIAVKMLSVPDAITSAVGNCGINCIKLTALGRFLDQGVQIDENMMQKWLKTVDFDENGFVDFYDWRKLIEEHERLDQMFQKQRWHIQCQNEKMEPLLNCLTEAESRETVNMMERIVRTIEHGKRNNLRTMIDAEQTYFQPAISRLAMAMMRKSDTSCLKDIELDLHLARREGFHFGCKVVRGAYIEQERKRAAALNYEDPINPNIEASDAKIDQESQERSPGSISVMAATHNEKSVKHVVEMMREAKISPLSEIVSFAQLYGMCDQVSYSLANADYSVYKYVPYGPIDKVLPYLSRRAQENASVLGKIRREVSLMFRELMRRAFTLSG